MIATLPSLELEPFALGLPDDSEGYWMRHALKSTVDSKAKRATREYGVVFTSREAAMSYAPNATRAELYSVDEIKATMTRFRLKGAEVFEREGNDWIVIRTIETAA